MTPSSLLSLADHLWQSTLFGAAVGIVTPMLHANRAAVRHRLWLAASLKFIIPFTFLVGIGSHFQWRTAPANAPTPIVNVVSEIAQPFTVSSVSVATANRIVASRPSRIPGVFLYLWICGFAASIVLWSIRWLQVRKVLRRAAPLTLDFPIQVMSCLEPLEPGVFGVLKPVLLLPEGIADRLTTDQLQAVLAHELCHVRRRDNLATAFHMFVESLFWFHPLVWWIKARLIAEQERACDEEVLHMGGDPQVYAESILKICEFYVASPLICVSGLTGSGLRKRIEEIMTNRISLELNRARQLLLVTAGMLTLAVPVTVGILHAPQTLARSRQSAFDAASFKPFDVTSVKPCKPASLPPGARGGSVSGGSSPGRIYWNCRNVAMLIRVAYVLYANGQTNPSLVTALKTPVLEGPDWIDSDTFDITAKIDGTPRPEVMQGPMLQTLLEDRFKLKIHIETREVPAFTLSVARGGPKLSPFKEGSCVLLPADFHAPGPGIGDGPISERIAPPPLEPGLVRCRSFGNRRKGNLMVVDSEGGTMDALSGALTVMLGRPVTNKTGIAGRFDYHYEYTPDQDQPAALPSDEPPGPTIFAALEQLGLKLEPAKGPGEFIVIDHVERPRAD